MLLENAALMRHTRRLLAVLSVTWSLAACVAATGDEPEDLAIGEGELASCRNVWVHIATAAGTVDPSAFAHTPPNLCWRWNMNRRIGTAWGFCESNPGTVAPHVKAWGDPSNYDGSHTPYFAYNETRDTHPDISWINTCLDQLTWHNPVNPLHRAPGRGYEWATLLTGSGCHRWKKSGHSRITMTFDELYGGVGGYAGTLNSDWRGECGRPMMQIVRPVNGGSQYCVYKRVHQVCDRIGDGASMGAWFGGGSIHVEAPGLYDAFIRAMNDCSTGVSHNPYAYDSRCDGPP